MVRAETAALRHVVALSLGLVVLAGLLASCASAPPRPPEATASQLCPPRPPCGDQCSNQPFVANECWTTRYGPAKADVVTSPHNFLFCRGGSYALCFFSGPPNATGTQSTNRALPCVLNGDVANCTCQVYTSGPYFVDINAILNQGAYYETVKACGHDGSGCANLQFCGSKGSDPDCTRHKPAPVCGYVQNQNPNDASVSLMPKADLVSTFSFAMHADYKIGKVQCDGDHAGLYAGCMTAPCFFPPGAKQPPADGDPIQCQCPTYRGTYQVGQEGQTCKIPPADGSIYVWSASNTVSSPGGK